MPDSTPGPPDGHRIRAWLYLVIFESNTRPGQWFDIALLVAIVLSVAAVMLDSIAAFHDQHAGALLAVEWAFTLLFSVEYALRVYCAPRRLRYMGSFFGVVDLLAIVPTYLSLLLPGTQYLLVVRLLRVLRIFRVLKIVSYLGEANLLLEALRESRRKILVFLLAVVILVTVNGALMYLIEGPGNGFTSIPTSIYWAVVTMTTVGYGDISPQTPAGQFLASIVMVLGYSILAVPTGIVSVEISQAMGRQGGRRNCARCGHTGHAAEARYCLRCGERLESGAD
jgi:voltage-gated potassium channel